MNAVPPPRPRVGSRTCALHFQIKPHLGGARRAEVFRIGGLGAPLARNAPARPPLPGGDGAPGELPGRAGSLGHSPLPRHRGVLGAGNAEAGLQPRGGSRGGAASPPATPGRRERWCWPWGTKELKGALQRSSPFWRGRPSPVSSGPKPRKQHLLRKPQESETQRPSPLPPPENSPEVRSCARVLPIADQRSRSEPWRRPIPRTTPPTSTLPPGLSCRLSGRGL